MRSRWHQVPFKNMAILTHFLHLRVFAVHIASNTHASQISHHGAKLSHVNSARQAYITADERPSRIHCMTVLQMLCKDI